MMDIVGWWGIIIVAAVFNFVYGFSYQIKQMWKKTFRLLNAKRNVVYDFQVEAGEETSLTQWYKRVQDKSFHEFEIEDVCCSIRQNLYPEYIMPFAAGFLRKNIVAGELYEGELLFSLSVIPSKLWVSFPRMRKKIRWIVEAGRSSISNPEILEDAAVLFDKLNASEKNSEDASQSGAGIPITIHYQNHIVEMTNSLKALRKAIDVLKEGEDTSAIEAKNRAMEMIKQAEDIFIGYEI